MSLTRRYGGLSILLSQSVISRLLFFCAVVAPIFHAYDSVSVIVVTAAQAEGECDANSSDQSCAAPIDQEEGTGDDRECVDTNPSCRSWASVGECDNNPNYMLIYCPISCDSCPEKYDRSLEEEELLKKVAKFGKPQKVEGQDSPKTFEVVRKTVHYMENDIFSDNPTHDLSDQVLGECTNREELCAFWAAIGECEANKAYMKVKCAPSCQSCHMIDFDSRCPPLGKDVRPGFLPGELNAMFERIVETAPGNQTVGNAKTQEGMTNYTVHILSRPGPYEGLPIISEEYDKEQPPWIITFENFLTEEECQKLIELGYQSNYERSKDVGQVQVDGSYDSVESSTRTSENAWCSDRNKCRNDPTAQLIHDRISFVTGLPANNSEDLQLLKYEVGQFYRKHHDYIEHQQHRRCGPRVLTFFLYLSGDVEGGATNFPKLGIAVKPKVGRALLWPSVLNSDPSKKDHRTDHEAQDVLSGVKYGANAWLHLHDYLAAQELGCT
ncbi:hypothetical protein ACHAXS_000736 [Conticribra weissflogii]